MRNERLLEIISWHEADARLRRDVLYADEDSDYYDGMVDGLQCVKETIENLLDLQSELRRTLRKPTTNNVQRTTPN